MTPSEQVERPASSLSRPGLAHRLRSWLGAGRLFGGVPWARTEAAFELYREVVAAARRPEFFADCGVPDTPDGRLEMIGLQAVLMMRRLRREGEAGQAVAQALFDAMFADIDRNFREQGVGDLSVGKHVKRAARTFLARYRALDPLLDAADVPGMARVLHRNIFNLGEAAGAGGVAPPAPAEGMIALALALLARERVLAGVAGGELVAGRVRPAADPAVT